MIADDATAFRPVSTKVRGAIRFETAEATDRTAYSCGRSNTLSRGFSRAMPGLTGTRPARAFNSAAISSAASRTLVAMASGDGFGASSRFNGRTVNGGNGRM